MLLVSDFDETLFTSYYNENIKAINDFVNNGHQFIIATGRYLESLEVAIADVVIPYHYLICSDGGAIYNADHQLIKAFPFHDVLATNILTYIASLFIHDAICEKTEDEKIVKIHIRYYEKEVADALIQKISQQFRETTVYKSANWINIIPIENNKSNAIQYLQQLLHIASEDIYTVGDSINDIEMLRDFHSFVIDNGKDQVQHYGKQVATSLVEVIETITSKKF